MAKGQKQKEFVSSYKNKFVFQKVGAAQWLDIMDDAEVNGVPKRSKLYPAILENVVVQPQLKLEDFDSEENDLNGSAELEEVIKEAIRFQQGK